MQHRRILLSKEAQLSSESELHYSQTANSTSTSSSVITTVRKDGCPFNCLIDKLHLLAVSTVIRILTNYVLHVYMTI